MTIFLVETYHQTTAFTTRELAEESIRQTKDKLIGGGYVGNIGESIVELRVHDRPFHVAT
jgi:hypothetical protein